MKKLLLLTAWLLGSAIPMTLQPVSGLWLPSEFLLPTTGALDTSTFLVDASGEQAAQIIKAPKTGNLWKVGFRTAAVTQNQTIRVSFQDVGSPDPDETQDQYYDIAIADTDDNVWKLTDVISDDGTVKGALRAVTAGDFVAVVWEHASFNSGDIFRLAGHVSMGGPFGSTYSDLKSAAGPAWAQQSIKICMVLLYDDGNAYYIPGLLPISATALQVWGSGSSPPKRGLKFRIPFKAEVARAIVQMFPVAATNNWDLKLYDEAGNVLATAQPSPHDADIRRSITTYQIHEFIFAPAVTLAINTWYYVMIEPTTAGDVGLVAFNVDQAGYLAQCSGGVDFHYADNSGEAGAWVATTTRRPAIQIGISALDDGVGGGVGAAMPTVISH